MSNFHNTQIFEQIQELVTLKAVIEWFEVDKVEAFEILNDLGAVFDNREDAYPFLSYLKEGQNDRQ